MNSNKQTNNKCKKIFSFITVLYLSVILLFGTLPAQALADTTPTPAPTSASTTNSVSPTPSTGSTPSERDLQRQQQIDQAKQDALKQYGPTPTPTNRDQTKQDAAQTYIQALTPSPTSSPTGSVPSAPSSQTSTSPTPTSSNPSTSSLPSQGSGGQAGPGASSGSPTSSSDNANSSGTGSSNNNSSGGTNSTNNTGASVVNSGNGAVSNNNASASTTNTNKANQNNSAVVGNNLQQATVTGGNSSSLNTGNSSVNTGNALSTGTIITGLNTNLRGVSVSEFNVNGNQNGDLVLDPQAIAANCISGCQNLGSAGNIGNGSGSTNAANVSEKSFDTTFQNNDAAVENSLTLNADSGHNKASLNTGGNSSITTGDANVAANSLTFLNDNVAGNVQYNVVNINGTLNGDIILPQSSVSSSGNSVSNTGNGTASNNTASSSSSTTNTTNQANAADIKNTISDSATTGDNTASENTKGNSNIKTGSASQDNHVLNVANTNVSGSWWLVIINKAGQWVGQLVGAPQGATMAGSNGTTFTADANGNVTASNPSTPSTSSGSSTQNSNNGAGSNNSTNQSQSNTNNTTQNNNAKVVNNLNLKANTGGNHADENTGGSSTVTTGNAHIVANIVNFVNTNVAKGGKLVVTIVNTFGTWLGNFITPDQKKIASSSSQTAQTNSATQTTVPTPQPTVDQSTPTPTQEQTVLASQDNQDNNNPQNTQNSGDQVLSGGSSNAHHIVYNYRRHRIKQYTALNTFANSYQNTSTGNGAAQLAAAATSNGAVEGLQTVDFKNTAVAGTTAHKKVITINLAWILFIAPAVLVFHFLRKKSSSIAALFRKKSII